MFRNLTSSNYKSGHSLFREHPVLKCHKNEHVTKTELKTGRGIMVFLNGKTQCCKDNLLLN